MEKIRLFIAIDIPGTLKSGLQNVQKQLKTATPHVKWVTPENLHLTLKFLGDTPKDECTNLKRVLQEMGLAHDPFTLALNGLGTFPKGGRPKVVWAGVRGQVEVLRLLQADIEGKLEKLGYPRENRPYSPHLTLGRPKQLGDLGNLVEQVKDQQSLTLGEWRVSSLNLMQSILRPSGPLYTVLAAIPLGTV